MKKPIFTKDNVLMMFELGLVVLKSMKDIYETKTEERILIKDDNTTTHSAGDNKENSSLSDSSINNR